MIVSLCTDTGMVREENQDYILCDTSTGYPFFLLADGMGGYNGGGYASRKAVEESFAFIKNALKSPDAELEESMRKAIIHSNRIIFEESKKDKKLDGMGTTLIIATITGDRLLVEHVGDSRLYIIRDNELIQITEDHSYVNLLIKTGELTKEEAIYHPFKNKITRAVGSEEQVHPDSYECKIKKDDIILICSDGLTKMVSNEGILNVVAKNEDLNDLAENFVDCANERGGVDNISVITIAINEVIV